MRVSTLALISAALPTLTSAAVIKRQDPATTYAHETAGLIENGLCRLYHGDSTRTLSTCTTCTSESKTCLGLNSGAAGGEFPTSTDFEGNQWDLGRCICDSPELAYIGEVVAQSLVLIGQATCMIWMKAVATIVDVGLAVVPLGREASLGLRIGVQAAKQFSKADGSDGFSLWMSPCAGPDYMKEDIGNLWTNLLKYEDPLGVSDDLKCAEFLCPDVDADTGMLLAAEAAAARAAAKAPVEETQEEEDARRQRESDALNQKVANGENIGAGKYQPGWCTMHVTHYQKPDPSQDQYSFDISLFDGNGAPIGNREGAVAETLSAKESIGLQGDLPWILILDAGDVDSDPVSFRYEGQAWTSNDQDRCSFGGYENGKREGDCGFTC